MRIITLTGSRSRCRRNSRQYNVYWRKIWIPSLACVFGFISLAFAEESAEQVDGAPLLKIESGAKVKIKELAFGEILFHYYQKNYFAALTRLDVAEYRSEVIEHQRELKLMRGVMYLSYGMLQAAETIFVEMLSQETRDEKLAQVRFYLAKTNYLNGFYDKALVHLELTRERLPVELNDEALLILSQIAYQKGQNDVAQSYLNSVSDSSEEGRFARFNLAIYLLQQNDVESALTLFDRLYPNLESTDVERSLYDRANLALGYYYLEKKDSQLAREHLLKVRLNGPYSNRAILALGWAYSEQGAHDKAVGHWRELLNRDPRDSAVQEASMALAFAYYRNGAKRESLEEFVRAAAMFGEQLTTIENAKQDLKRNLFDSWLDSRGIFGDKIFERWAVGDVPVTDYAVEYYLQQVVSTNEFNQYFHRYQEMSHLQTVMSRWQRQLPVYQQMLDNHQQRYQELKPQADAQTALMLDENYREKFESFAKAANDSLAKNQMWVIADADEQEIAGDLLRIKKTMDELPNDQFDMEDQQEQWRRIYGAALWNVAANYGPKRYHLEKQIKETREALSAFDEQTKSISSAGEKARGRFSNYDQRISGINDRINFLIQDVELEKELSRNAMEKVLLERLKKRKRELDFLLAQTELSIAKIQDEAVGRLLESTE